MLTDPHTYSSVLAAVGKTPLVRLERLFNHLDGTVLLKLEYLNPTHSKKDRIGLTMIEEAEKSGALRPGQTVVELTSGNTGTALAMVCAVKGYPFVAVMSRGNSRERADMMRALGAEVVLVDQRPGAQDGHVSGEDLKLVDRETKRITEERGAFRADQFENAANPLAYSEGLVRELLRQTHGKMDGFCDFAGTGGSFGGSSRGFQRYAPQVRCYLVEPEDAATLSGGPICNANHPIQGGGYALEELTHIDPDLVAGYLQVQNASALRWMRRLARVEGVFAGPSTGANLAAVEQLLKGEMQGRTVVTLANDSGMKYLSTGLWSN